MKRRKFLASLGAFTAALGKGRKANASRTNLKFDPDARPFTAKVRRPPIHKSKRHNYQTIKKTVTEQTTQLDAGERIKRKRVQENILQRIHNYVPITYSLERAIQKELVFESIKTNAIDALHNAFSSESKRDIEAEIDMLISPVVTYPLEIIDRVTEHMTHKFSTKYAKIERK
ncbi:MAG: hypothetical protein HOE11_00670 [Candidatus Diapherotrites archaeon]|jgi:hypothetical protein|nr:hypothetical protein [Candidatus Diapherotrites archaeon]